MDLNRIVRSRRFREDLSRIAIVTEKTGRETCLTVWFSGRRLTTLGELGSCDRISLSDGIEQLFPLDSRGKPKPVAPDKGQDYLFLHFHPESLPKVGLVPSLQDLRYFQREYEEDSLKIMGVGQVDELAEHISVLFILNPPTLNNLARIEAETEEGWHWPGSVKEAKEYFARFGIKIKIVDFLPSLRAFPDNTRD